MRHIVYLGHHGASQRRGSESRKLDYRDYGEPQSPTVGYQMQSPITSVPGLNATTAQQVNTGAQVQAQDLADLFKNAVFDEELMKQIKVIAKTLKIK